MSEISVFYSNVLDAAKESGLPMNTVLADFGKAGISALDFDYKHIKDGIPDKVTESGMKVNSVYAFFDLWKDGVFDEAVKVIDTARSLGAAAMFVAEKLPEETICSLKELKEKNDIFSWLDSCDFSLRTAEMLKKLSIYGSGQGVSVGVENFDSHHSLTERKYELEWLFSKAPHLKFNLDTGNSLFCGEDINGLFNLFREKIMNVHCKDRIYNDGKLRCAAVGTGIIPIAEIKKSLEQSGYKGNFSIEVFGIANMYSGIISSAVYLNNDVHRIRTKRLF